MASEYSRTTRTPQTTSAQIDTTETVIRTQLVAVCARSPTLLDPGPSWTSFAITMEHAVAMSTL